MSMVETSGGTKSPGQNLDKPRQVQRPPAAPSTPPRTASQPSPWRSSSGARARPTTRPRRTSRSRACRYRLRLSPARCAAAVAPGHARCPRPAKLASDNAASRSPQARPPRASTAATASRLIARLQATSEHPSSRGSRNPSAAALVCAPVPPRTQSFGCCLDPLQLLTQLTRGSKPLRGEHPPATVARAAEPPTVDLSTPPGHPLGAVTPRGERRAAEQRAAGPRNDSGAHNHDKSLHSTTEIPVDKSRISRETPCKRHLPTAGDGRFTRERSLVRNHPCPSLRKLRVRPPAARVGAGRGRGGECGGQISALASGAPAAAR
jgi:hypothetical protein